MKSIIQQDQLAQSIDGVKKTSSLKTTIRKKNATEKQMYKKLYPFYFSIGALVLYAVFLVIPGVLGLYYSFTDWNSYSDAVHWVGFKNFGLIMSSKQNYLSYIKNTIIFTIVTILLKTVIGLFFALLLNAGIKKLTNVYRVFIFLPTVFPMLVVGLLFKSILDPQNGVLNEFLQKIGLGVLAKHWLVDVHWALPSVIGVDTWKGVGYIMVILLAGLQGISKEYYEAAEIDGATAFAKLKNITIPLLMPAIVVTTVLNLLYGLKVFDMVYVLTNGGPGNATEVVFTSVFKEFSEGRYGVATAISTILFIVMAILGYFVIRLMSQEEDA